MNWSSKIVQGAIAFAVLLAVIYGCVVALEHHDKGLRDQWETAAKVAKLEQDNTRLESENTNLKAQIEDVKKQTAERVEASQNQRAAANTPEKQVMYVRNSVPGLHLNYSEDAPEVTMPKADLPALADLVGEKNALVIQLDGAKQELALTQKTVAGLTTEVANLKDENALLKKSKNGSKGAKFKWFVRGVAVGAGLAAFLL